MKKTLKKMLCGVCSAAMLMGAVTFSASAAHPFTDVKGDQWYANFVDYAYNHGLMAGTGSKSFSPNQVMTRGMLVTVIHAIAGKPAPTTGNHFSDVKANDYFAPAVTWCYENGIVAGTGAKTFSPNQKVTREQMVAIMMKFAKHTGADVSKRADLSGYKDASKIEGYAVDAFKWAVASGVVSGTSDNTLSPKAGAVRAQCAVVLQRYDEMLENQKPEPEKPTEPAPTEPAPTEPEVTEPAPTEPKPTEPKPTEPAPTEPEVTEPTCEHKWVEGAYEAACVCTNPECDYVCFASDAERAGMDIALYFYRNHKEQIENGLTEHSYEMDAIFNPFSLHPNRWKCSECGEETEVDPAPHKHDWLPADGIWICRICNKVVIDDPYGGHDHIWVHEHFDEIGHQDNVIECSCGAQIPESDAKKFNMSLEEYWKKRHADPLSALDGRIHTNQGIKNMWVVDTPAYDTWTCSECGKVENVDPNQA